MKRLLVLILVLLWVLRAQGQSQPCAAIRLPKISDQNKQDLENKLLKAYEEYKSDPTSADALIWYGRRMAYLGRYMEAIEVFTKGIHQHPKDARMYRHRGHRYITVRCFDQAVRDFEIAARLIKGTRDEVEADGLPNASNTPTSTLQSNIWYHLGLVYFLKGEFSRARKAYKNGIKVSTNPDMYLAMANWQYITFRRLHKDKKASALLANIDSSTKLLENSDYLLLLMLYKLDKSIEEAERALSENGNPLLNATRSFGVGHYILLKGDIVKARQVFTTITAGDQWASFGFLAAESELKKRF